MKWDYLALRWTADGWPYIHRLQDWLNNYGATGWELVILDHLGEGVFEAIFKRQG